MSQCIGFLIVNLNFSCRGNVFSLYTRVILDVYSCNYERSNFSNIGFFNNNLSSVRVDEKHYQAYSFA